MRIDLYSKPDCSFCVSTKNWFDEHNVRYNLYDITESDENFDNWLKLKQRTVPQIVTNGKYLGNYDTLMDNKEMFLFNDTLGLPESEFQSFLEYKEMADKLEFMRDNNNSNYTNLAKALAKSVFSEGISLFASFVMLLNFQQYGKMKGMSKVVEWSVRDESIHVEGMSQLFRDFCLEHPKVITDEFKKDIYDMLRMVVKLEDKFIDLAYGEETTIEHLFKEDVKLYIRHIADRRLLQLGFKPNFNVSDNPLPWLDWILNAPDHTNFFENRVTEYEVGGLKGSWGDVYK
jgi:ribonucleotide reductase beta subunit family protein with ferritin-like domain